MAHIKDRTTRRRLLAVLAHPDDESLGVGGTLARYAAEGVETYLVTATRGQAGRYRGEQPGSPDHPGPDAVAAIRSAELEAAARTLGVSECVVLDHADGALAQVPAPALVREIAGHVRRIRPDVVVTFAPDGAYGHPDHIAISQTTTAAVVAAASADGSGGPAHATAKLYYMAWTADTWAAYQAAFKTLVSRVDGIERRATPWPDWAVTTVVDTRAYWPVVWRAVQCHDSQIGAYASLRSLPANLHEALWGRQSFYRAYSTVNGGRHREIDLFEGLPS